MNIVPIIAEGSLVKSHTEYPVTNPYWKLMNNGLGLWDYLNTLQLIESPYALMNFAGIRDFYLRERYPNWIGYDLDPWNRKFIVMPPSRQIDTSRVYRYYSYSSVNLSINVDIIVTTVSRSRVYCVDITRIL